jgi:hypothetical protein
MEVNNKIYEAINSFATQVVSENVRLWRLEVKENIFNVLDF